MEWEMFLKEQNIKEEKKLPLPVVIFILAVFAVGGSFVLYDSISQEYILEDTTYGRGPAADEKEEPVSGEIPVCYDMLETLTDSIYEEGR